MTKYVTVAGDDVVGILYRKFSRDDDAIEREFWALNPAAALSLIDNIFPQGVSLVLPLPDVVVDVGLVSPWD